MNELGKLIIVGWIMFGILLTPIIFGVLDFISGTHKARQRGEKITSDGWRRSVKKVAGYYNMLLALVVVDVMHISCSWFLNTYYGYSIPMFPFITLIGAFVVAAIEIKSIREKAEDKVKKQMNEVAALVADIIRHKADPSDAIKDLIEFLNRKEASNESK